MKNLAHIDKSIAQIMHRHVISADVTLPIQKCAELIIKQKIGCLIITKDKRPIGIITERCFVELIRKGFFDSTKVNTESFMVSPLITIGINTTYAEAIEVFHKENIKRIPVVENEKIVGLLTLKNMFEYSRLEISKLTETQKLLKHEANFDDLTHVYNKKTITTSIEQEYERIKRTGGRSALLFVDIDHFKKVNDKYSHAAGDHVLSEMGKLLKETCRQLDVIGRFGGEEFVIIAPNRKKYGAVNFGERLRSEIENHPFQYKGTAIPLTVSIGIASLFMGRDYTAALDRADKALYHAKANGRNCVALWRLGSLAVADKHIDETMS